MQEPQATPEKSGINPNVKWVALFLGVGCALLVCIALVIGLVVAFFVPVTGEVFSEINEELDVPQATLELIEPDLSEPSEEILTPETMRYPNADANRMGDPNAPVKIIVYSDFQCIYCMQYWDETETIIIEFYVQTGKAYYEYRSFGDFLGPESAAAAEGAYCAGAQDKFWEYHDILFINWTGEGSGDFSPDRLEQYAKEIDLDVKDFSTCLADGTYKSWVEQDVINAQADGIRATPSFLINGKLVEGAQPFSVFQSEIEAALGEK